MKNLRLHLLSLATLTVGTATAADLLWDGGTADITTNGDGLPSFLAGNWGGPLLNWDQGPDLPHVAWTNGSTAIFGGTPVNTIRTINLASDITAGQVKIISGSTGNFRFDIGTLNATTFSLAFDGNYSDSLPAIDAAGALNTNFNAKITGDLSARGGLVIAHGSNITAPGSSGRFALTNAANDFTGDVTLLSGNLSAGGGPWGVPANKLVLKGGSIFVSAAAAVTTVNGRNIVIGKASGISTNAVTAGVQALELTGAITGSADLTRYSNVSGSAISDVRLKGDMSGFTGLFENRGTSANALVTVETTAASGGAWKISGGTVKLNTAAPDSAIANGAGKSDLLMGGGILDLNGKSETINGLSGPSGFVRNSLVDTEAVLTLGSGDATASFGGTIENGTGTVALTKTGGGSQTLDGIARHGGPTNVDAGSLVVSGSLELSPVRVKSGASLVMADALMGLKSLALDGGSTLSVPVDESGTGYLEITETLTLSGGSVTIVPTFLTAPALGDFDLVVAIGGVSGTATLVPDFASKGPTRVNGSVKIVGDTLSTTISTLGANLVWNNAAATAAWNLNADANFLNGAASDKFLQYDKVLFNATSPAGTVTLAGDLHPAAVMVDSPGNFTFAGTGSIRGSSTLTKAGGGTLTIANANTASGDITVTGGTLAVDGSLGSGDVQVGSGTTLTGSGSLAGFVTVEGVISPGNGVGTLTTGPMIIDGSYRCQIDGVQSDKLVVNGDLNLSDATLDFVELSPATAPYYVIASCTGSVIGTIATPPAGYLVDTSAPGQVILWKVVAPAGNTITFESAQGYDPDAEIAAANGSAADAPYDGAKGWSRSTSNGPARTVASASSGEYLGGQALSTVSGQTYIGGLKGTVEVSGTNTIRFDAQFAGGIGVGFMKDHDGDGLFDQGSAGANGDTGLAFGVGGSPTRFQIRRPAFGTETASPLAGVAGRWYRIQVTIGEVVAGNRELVMAVRDLTTGADLDFDTVAPGIQPWTITVTAAEFGPAPELSNGFFVRATSGGANGAKLDNLRFTTVEPPVGTAYDTWIDSFPTLTGDDRLAGSDPDDDGTDNLLEFVLNGNPTVSDLSILPQQTSSTGNLLFTFLRRDDSEGVAALKVQHGTNLAVWTDVVIGAADGSSGGVSWTVAENGANPDLITVTLPAGTDPKKFIRLVATQ